MKKLGAGVVLAILAFLGWRLAITGDPDNLPVALLESGDTARALAAEPALEVADREVARRPLDVADERDAAILVQGRVVNRPYPGLSPEEASAGGVPLEVRLSADEHDSERLHVAGVETAPDGRFEVEVPDDGDRPRWVFVLARETDRYRTAYIERKIEGAGPVAIDVPRVPHGTLVGRCVDLQENPLGHVRVTLRKSFSRETHGVVADADGTFRVEHSTWGEVVGAELDGYTLIEAADLETRKEGGWEPAVVRLSPAAGLRVRVTDTAGRPVEGASIVVHLSTSEEESRAPRGWGATGPRPRRLETDAAGVAEFPAIWSDKEILIEVSRSGTTITASLVVDGRLVMDGSSQGSPIVLPRGGVLEVSAVLAEALHLRGRVIDEMGAGVPEPWIEVRNVSSWDESELQELRGDSTGRFTCTLTPTSQLRRVRITASDRRFETRSGETIRAASEVLDLSAMAAGAEVVLALEPTFEISGRVLADDEKPTRHRVHAVPAGAAFVFATDALGKHSFQAAGPYDGSFVLRGLPAGTYDLHVSYGGSFAQNYRRFPSIAAGTTGLELRIPAHGQARVRLRILPPDDRLERALVVVGMRTPREPFPPDFPGLEPFVRVDSAANWPAGVPLWFRGSAGHLGPAGVDSFRVFEIEGTEHDLEPLAEGHYWFGVEAFDVDGDPYFPMSTELVRVPEGEYEVEFELKPTASLRGTVVGMDPVADLVLALVDERGRPIPPRIRDGAAVRFLEISAQGTFLLEHAPAGRHVLRVGTADELERGEPRKELTIDILPGKNPELRIELP